jgi:hypothetical protein
MKVRLSIDRFEGMKKEIVVLLTDDARQIDFPRDLLPNGAKAGEVLSFEIDRDMEATRELLEETRKIQEELKKTDPGGDIKL